MYTHQICLLHPLPEPPVCSSGPFSIQGERCMRGGGRDRERWRGGKRRIESWRKGGKERERKDDIFMQPSP